MLTCLIFRPSTSMEIRPNLKNRTTTCLIFRPSTSMEIRPCFSSVCRRRLKFSTLPSAVNLDFWFGVVGSYTLSRHLRCALSSCCFEFLCVNVHTKRPCGVPETNWILNAELVLEGPQRRGRVVGPILGHMACLQNHKLP